jgi:hypothetical protein
VHGSPDDGATPKTHPVTPETQRRTRVAVVTMKAQLRGRIRREIQTLLDRGYDVLVVGLQSKGDFLQGLTHERLEVRLLKPESLYTKGVGVSRSVLMALTPGGRARSRA